MKSVIEVRKFAVENAVQVLGQGSASKDIVGKAKEIESYILEGIELPGVYDEARMLGDMFSKGVGTVLGVKDAMAK